MNVPGVVVLCEQSEIRISFQCKRLRIRTIKKNNESGNIYESGKVCPSVNLVLIDSSITCMQSTETTLCTTIWLVGFIGNVSVVLTTQKFSYEV